LRRRTRAGGLQLNMSQVGQGLQDAQGQLSARSQAFAAEMGQNVAQLSARAGKWFQDIGKNVGKVGELLPTQTNKENRAATKIQKAWRSYGAQSHFHEERGAALMLQSAARRKKAQSLLKYKQTLNNWAAIVIQEAYRRHKLKQKAKELAEANAAATTPRSKSTVVGRLAKSLSFSRRTTAKTTAAKVAKPSVPADVTAEDLRAEGLPYAGATSGSEATSVASTSRSSDSAATPEPTKKRSLSFMRRKKAAEEAQMKAV